MDYNEILKNARECSGPYCKACPVCNGMACRTQVPGPGGKGTAATMLRNYQKWQEVCINMDTICENAPIDTTFTLFGRKFAAPIFAAPVGAMKLHYGDKYDDLTYNDILVSSCAQAGIAAFTGDGTNPAVMEGALHAITAAGGLGVPTVKPWNMETVFAKLDAVRRADPMAVAMDIDAAGLPFLKGLTPPAGSKTVEELRQIIDYAQKPFIVKGVMTVRGALKALEAGASGIVVSNHGGRVQDQCPSTAEVLPAIADAVGGKLTILVDGGLRNGTDIFKALAMGADFCMLGRYFSRFDESPTSKVLIGGSYMKEYWGEGSARARNWQRYDLGGKTGLAFEEGVDSYVTYAGSLQDNVARSLYKVKSTMCNCGVTTIPDLQKNAKLTLVSATSIVEGGYHDVMLRSTGKGND